jgi:hypothetical protein
MHLSRERRPQTELKMPFWHPAASNWLLHDSLRQLILSHATGPTKPPAALVSNTLARHGQALETGDVWFGVNRVTFTARRSLPAVYPDKQTFSLFVGIFKGASSEPSCSVQMKEDGSGVS